MRWLDSLDWSLLFVFALLLTAAPTFPMAVLAHLFGNTVPYPMPHLLEKLLMLTSGTLTKPLDIFDLLMHGTPITLLILKAVRTVTGRGDNSNSGNGDGGD